jgi:hypothetical protein
MWCDAIASLVFHPYSTQENIISIFVAGSNGYISPMHDIPLYADSQVRMARLIIYFLPILSKVENVSLMELQECTVVQHMRGMNICGCTDDANLGVVSSNIGSIPTLARHIFQACPVWIYTQSNITSILFT